MLTEPQESPQTIHFQAQNEPFSMALHVPVSFHTWAKEDKQVKFVQQFLRTPDNQQLE